MKRKSDIIPLLLILILPTTGTLSAMYWFPDSIGKSVYGICRLLILAVPLFWIIYVEKYKRYKVKLPLKHILLSVLSGVIISIFIILGYDLFGHVFADSVVVSEKLADIGGKSKSIFALGFVYWVLINSFFEEFVWRFFLIRILSRYLNTISSILVSAFMFTIHLFFVLKYYFGLGGSLFWSGCIFFTGIIWAVHFRTSKSIIPGYISHAIADAAIFYVGARIIGIC